MIEPPEQRPCSATTAKGEPCRRIALPNTEPPRCVSHIGVNGRKTTLNDEVADRLVSLLKAGNYVETALAAAGIGKQTFYDWLERGDPSGTTANDRPFREFRARVEQARAEGEARNVAIVAKAAASDWKAAAWMLERQFPDRWARPNTLRSGGGAAPIDPGGKPHHEEHERGAGATVTPLDAIRRRAARRE